MKRAEEVAAVSRELLAPLRRSPIVISSSDEGDAERERLVPRLRSLVREVPQIRASAARRRRYRLGYSMAAATLLLLGVGSAIQRFRQTEPAARSVPQDGTTVVDGRLNVDRAGTLAKGSRFTGEAAVETPKDASARFVTESGVEVALSSASKAHLRPNLRRERVDLMRGQVTLNVPRLPKGSTVTVVTPEATVTVHGTRFSVSYDANAARPSTCVRVTEGVVEVRRHTGRVQTVRAGQSSGCDRLDPPEKKPPLPRALRAKRRTGGQDGPTSTLAVENRLLRAGLAAEQRGDPDAARAALEELLARFPGSPLAEDAKRALVRLEHQR